MNTGICLTLTRLLNEKIKIYSTGLMVKGILRFIDVDLGIIAVQQTNEPIIINIDSIIAIESEKIGDTSS